MNKEGGGGLLKNVCERKEKECNMSFFFHHLTNNVKFKYTFLALFFFFTELKIWLK